jgi:DNA-binding response OmpR family regulator
MGKRVLNSLTLLYIEDDKDIQEIYRSLLEEWVEHVHCASDGEEGYAKYLSLQPDIILLDINMPKIDGLSLAKKIREVDKDVKMIITTSHGEQDKLIQAIELYLVKYILKPIEPDILKDAMDKAITEILEARESDAKSKKVFLLDNNVLWNVKTEKLTRDGEEIRLTKNERKLLVLLSRDKNKVCTFFEIYEYLSQDDFDKEFDANQIRALVKLVRKKVPKNSIMNVYGEGYRFNPLRSA